MKRIGNLYERIIDLDNLRLADKKARKGKLNSYGVKVYDKNIESNLLWLQSQLKNKTFTTSKYTTFKIYEPKERLIFRLPYFPDRIVHHAVMNILESVWVSVFTSDTFSCIKKRGISGAFKKVKIALMDHDNIKYCLKIDIKKFYPSIDHIILKQIIRKKIKCKDTLYLLDNIIDSTDGVPIGNYLSQYFANLYLTYFDHWIKEVKKVKYYFRYADDMVFLSNNKDELHKLFLEINEYITKKLNLTIKSNNQIFPIAKTHKDKFGRGLDFLGYVFYLNEIRMRKGIKKNLCSAMLALDKKSNVSDRDYKQRMSSWFGWIKSSKSIHLLEKIIRK